MSGLFKIHAQATQVNPKTGQLESSSISWSLLFLVILISSFVSKLCLLDYGNPHLFHPDETYIYKDAFKQLQMLSEGNIGFVTNPYNLLLSIWYVICYPFGKMLGAWTSFADYKDQVIAESFNVIYTGRIFSLLVSTLASTILFRYFASGKDAFNKLLIGVFIFFNPLEWISDLWIKFDPICYLMNVIVLIRIVRYWEGKTCISSLGVWLGLAFAVRMDFLSYVVGLFLLMLFKAIPFPSHKDKFRFIGAFILTYLITTNLWLHMLIGMPEAANIDTTKGFISVFVGKVTAYSLSDILGNMKNNIVYYLICFLVIQLPLLTYDFVYHRMAVLRSKQFLLLQLFLFTMLLIFNYAAPHYLLVTQVCYLFFLLKRYVPVNPTKTAFILSGIAMLWVLSLSVEIVYAANFMKDTRVEAAEYLINHSQPGEMIAIDRYQNVGYVPALSECPERLLAKAEQIKKMGTGTGQTFELKAKQQTGKCRNVLEVYASNRFGTDSIAKSFLSTYDTSLLKLYRTPFYVARSDEAAAPFMDFIKRHSSKPFVLERKFVDPRMSFFQTEPFHISFLIYPLHF